MSVTKINMTKEEALEEFLKYAIAIERNAKTPQEVASIYDKWGYNYEYCENLLECCLHNFIVDLLESIHNDENIGKDAYILDIGAGTGLVGKTLRNRGFGGKINALDGSSEMLKVSMKLPGVYDRSICHVVEPDTAMPGDLSNGVYDVTLVCSILILPHMMHHDCLKHFVNSVRVGGLVLFTLRKATSTDIFNFNVGVQREAFRLESLGVWKLVDMKYRKGYRKGLSEFQETESVDAFVYAYKKVKNL